MLPLIIVAVILILLAGYAVIDYNSLVGLKSRVDESWSGIDVQLKRRSSLIPNLVETVKGYATHEREVFEQVTQARASLVHATTPKDKAAADQALSGTLTSLFAVAEAYPDLKANENFLSLQRDLSDTEDKIAYARQFYNTNARQYNVKTRVFPSVLIANALHFLPVEFYEAEAFARVDVPVSFTEETVSTGDQAVS